MSLKNIMKNPEYVESIGNIYPIEVKDYDEFQECAGILYISKKHFKIEGDNDYNLLDLIIYTSPPEILEININKLTKLFQLTLKTEVKFEVNDDKSFSFVFFIYNSETDENEKRIIDGKNYDQIRVIIMNQNIVIEPKIYKSQSLQDRADEMIAMRSKNSPKISFEDILTTVSKNKGISYEDLCNCSIYQIYSDFYRIRKEKDYFISALFRSVGSDIPMTDYAEELDLYHSPYDDLFVDSGKSKINGLNTK